MARVASLLLVLLAVPGFAWAVAASPPTPTLLPLVFHVAGDPASDVAGKSPVVDAAFLARQLSAANRVFEPHGVRFEHAGVQRLPARHRRMETRADRNALGARVRDGVVNCFVVESLRDVDEPGRMRRGVHWRSRSVPGTRYVILSSISEQYVLAHELGHYLGNPKHSDVPGNLMSYSRADGVPSLDGSQLRKVRAMLTRLRTTGEVKLR